MNDKTPAQHVAELIKDFRIALLTTRNAEGRFVAHPLTVQETEFDGDLWFLVSKGSTFVSDLRADDGAGISLSSNDSWVSLSGSASLVEDRARVREMWSSLYEAWFPEGVDDPDLGLLKFTAESAEYWDTPGGKIAAVFSLVKAKLTGGHFEADNETVELPDR